MKKTLYQKIFVIVFAVLMTVPSSFYGDGQVRASENHVDTLQAIGPGDVDGKNSVTVIDAILVLRHIVGLIDLQNANALPASAFPAGAYNRANVNGDGLTVMDAILILRHIVGLIDSFPNLPVDPLTYEDYQALLDLVYGVQLYKLNFAETISNGFTVPFTADIDHARITTFFDEQAELHKSFDDLGLLDQFKNSNIKGLAAPGQLSPELFDSSATREDGQELQAGIQAIVVLPLFAALAGFAYFTHRSRVNARERILKVAGNMTDPERQEVFNELKSGRFGEQINETNPNDFWRAIENGNYDNQAAQMHNDLYHSGQRYSEISSDPAMKVRPVDAFIQEGAEGVIKGTNVLAAITKTVAPKLGKGIEYAEKIHKYTEYIQKVYEGKPTEALKKYINDQLKDLVDQELGEGVADSLELIVEMIHNEDPTLKPPPGIGTVKIADNDPEGAPASIAIATGKNEADETIAVVSEITQPIQPPPPAGPTDQIIIPLPEGKWQVDVIDTDDDQDSVNVDVTSGTDTVVQVDTTPLGNFHITTSVTAETADSKTYLVSAHVSGISAPITLTIDVQNAVTGGSTKTLNQDGSVSWSVIVGTSNGSATITRNDTNESKAVSLPAAGIPVYSLSLWASPATPGEWVGVTVYASITPAVAGVEIRLQVSGTDGYSQDTTQTTNAEGIASTYVPGGAQGVTDTITVTVVATGATRTLIYTFE